MTLEERAEEYADKQYAVFEPCAGERYNVEQAYIAGAKENGIQWHKVADGKLPELDKKVWVIRSADDDLPMVAKRHIYTCYGRTEWEWACYWGSGFDLRQNEIFAWCEIPPFEE